MNGIFFVDREGNKRAIEGISFHIELARRIIETDEKLKAEFEASERRDPSDFLVYDKDWVKVTQRGYGGRCSYFSNKLSPQQRMLIRYFTEYGYTMDDLFLRELQRIQKEREDEEGR